MDSDKLQETRGLYHFGAFRLDAAERRLWCDDEPISLTPKEFELLFYLVEHAGSVAKKDELLDAVWTDTYIAESTLARNVSWLRKKLSECADGELIIETVPTIGYRFTAEVTRSDDNGNSLIIEEQIVQHFRGEEIVTIDEGEKGRKGDGVIGQKVEDLPPSPHHPVTLSPLLFIALGFVALAGIGFVVYQNYFKTRATKAVATSRVVPFSGAAGYENSPAFSPDGNQLAYSWNGGEGENTDIYIKLIGAGDPLQLTDTKVNEQYPTFSPDGKHIAFIRGKYGEPGEVIIVPALGGAERRVATLFSGNYSISFSPDGRHIAVVDTADSMPDGQFAIYLVNIQSGERRRVTVPAEFDGESTPRFSPDGKSLAFIRSARNVYIPNVGQHDLFVVPVEANGGAKEPRQLTFDGVIIHSLAWSADGEYIYFVPYRPRAQTFIRRIPAAGGEQEIVSLSGNEITNIAVSPNGKTLAFAEEPGKYSIVRVLPDGRPAETLIKSTADEIAPQFSPDGSKIVFQSNRTGRLQIWSVDADGKNLQQITDSKFPSVLARFSPDGSRLVYNQREGGNFANYIIPIKGGEPRRISPEGVWEDYPIWSADGEYIYFTSNRTGKPNIWRTKADGTGEAVQITDGGAFRAAPAPDGKTVYFTRTEFSKEMWRVPANGGAEELVPEFEAAGFDKTWEMTRTGIYFIASADDENLQMKFYDFADGQVKDALADYQIPTNINRNMIATDGKVFLLTMLEKSSRLMLADLP
ncbi:MAG: winged helix-turn-helix domain-containing protein [Pyrinomonadaceae bacterium]